MNSHRRFNLQSVTWQ